MRLILIFFQILYPVEPLSNSIGSYPSSLSLLMVALVAAAPKANFSRKLTSLLKLVAGTKIPLDDDRVDYMQNSGWKVKDNFVY